MGTKDLLLSIKKWVQTLVNFFQLFFLISKFSLIVNRLNMSRNYSHIISIILFSSISGSNNLNLSKSSNISSSLGSPLPRRSHPNILSHEVDQNVKSQKRIVQSSNNSLNESSVRQCSPTYSNVQFDNKATISTNGYLLNPGI